MAYSRGTQIEDEISLKIIDIAMEIALEEGIASLTVSKIINRMGVTNRVFYNRFKDILDVITAIYDEVVKQLRSCFDVKYDGKQDLCEYIMNLAVSVLEKTYETKLHFAGYLYNYEAFLEENREWWINQIIPLIDYGKNQGIFKQIDSKHLAYSVWCYCRGFNASSIGDNLSKDDAINAFRLGFKCLIDGARK